MAVTSTHSVIDTSHAEVQIKDKVSITSSEVLLPQSSHQEIKKLHKPSFLLPVGAFDTHVHVFDPQLGPYSPTRSYTPERASFSSLNAFSKTLSSSLPSSPATFVLVQPSPYRTDNRVLLHLLQECLSTGITARGIAVVDINNVTEEQLQEMHQLGVRGLRLNLQADGKAVQIDRLKGQLSSAADRISKLPNWKLQIYAPAYVWAELHDTIMDLPVPIIADHLGGLLGASKLPLELVNNPIRQPGLQSLLSLAKAAKVFIKISGLYRASDDTQGNYADLGPIIRHLANEVPEKLIWGSDWPHTGEGKDRARNQNIKITESFRNIDNSGILKHLREWIGSEENWMKMMVETPKTLFQ